jgi:TolA-binding protein
VTVVDLHPEELLDKLVRGGLSASDRQRLDAHVAVCEACRFELEARRDFMEVAVELPAPVFVGSERRGEVADMPPPEARRKRRPLWFITVAALLSSGVSFGAWVTEAVRSEVRPPPPPAPRAARPPSRTRADAPRRSGVRTEAPDPERVLGLEDLRRGDRPSMEPSATREDPRARTRSEPQRPREHPTTQLAGSVGTAGSALARDTSPAVRAENVAPVETASDLFRAANQARRDGDPSRAVDLYRALQSRYPDSDEARLSRATSAQLLLDRGDAKAALEGFDQYLAHDGTLLGEEALVGRALSLQKLGARDEEIAAWREVLSRFPQSVHARAARARLAALGQR